MIFNNLLMMKALVSLILLLLLQKQANTQADGSTMATIQFPYIDQPVSIYRDSLICTDAGSTGKSYAEKSDCFSYRHTDSLQQYPYGPVAFSGVFFFPDKQTGIILSIMHHKVSLWGKDSVNVKKDFRLLAAYLDTAIGKRSLSDRPLDEREKEYRWVYETYQLTLQLTTVEKKRGRKLSGILSLYIEKKK
jgi:hypothetical protein